MFGSENSVAIDEIKKYVYKRISTGYDVVSAMTMKRTALWVVSSCSSERETEREREIVVSKNHITFIFRVS
jgi:hypothetical protein